MHALSDIGELIKSYKTAEVHGALETLQFRLQDSNIPAIDHDVRGAIKTLQEYRIWLSSQRSGSGIPLPVRTEILRAEVLVTLAESRARCFVGDEDYAVFCIEQSLEDICKVVRDAWSEITRSHGTHALFLNEGKEDENWVEIFSWMNHKNWQESAYDILNEMAMERISYTVKQEMRMTKIKIEKSSFAMEVQQEMASSWLDGVPKAEEFFGRLQNIIDSQNLDIEEENQNQENEAADVASLSVCYRLACSLESVLAVCAAMQAIGDPVRDLLLAKEKPGSPAIVIEMQEPVAAD